MVNPNVLGSHSIAVAAVVSPASVAPGAVNSAWVAAGGFARLMAVLKTGTLGAAATVDMKLEQATDAAGAGAKDITGKAITQIVKATGDDKQAIINLRPEELDKNNDFDHVRISITVAAAASDLAAELLCLNPRFGPVTQPASVVEAIT